MCEMHDQDLGPQFCDEGLGLAQASPGRCCCCPGTRLPATPSSGISLPSFPDQLGSARSVGLAQLSASSLRPFDLLPTLVAGAWAGGPWQ